MSGVDYNLPSLLSAQIWEPKYSVQGKGLTCLCKYSLGMWSAGLTKHFQVVFLKKFSKKLALCEEPE